MNPWVSGYQPGCRRAHRPTTSPASYSVAGAAVNDNLSPLEFGIFLGFRYISPLALLLGHNRSESLLLWITLLTPSGDPARAPTGSHAIGAAGQVNMEISFQ